MEQFKKFAEKHNVTLEQVWLPNRTDGAEMQNMTHWNVTLIVNGKAVHTFQYSQGIGHAQRWLTHGKGKKFLRQHIPNNSGFARWKDYYPLPWNKKYHEDSAPVVELHKLYGKHHKLDVGEILLSLQMDSAYCDIPFESWASEYGYSEDSIKAKKTWEACNTIRRAINAAFTSDQLSEFWELEE